MNATTLRSHVRAAAMVLVLAAGCAPESDAQREADRQLAAGIDAYMQSRADAGFSGGVLVARGGTVLIEAGYGMADRGAAVPFTEQTVFTVGSLTKQFTGAAILKLEMMGRLNVEDSIAEYFEGVPVDKSGIAIHHLLTHSAGFPDALGFDFDAISRDDYVEQALAADLLFEPGTSYRYSNVGYSLLAAIIEAVAGTTYAQFVRRQLFEPAGMTSTGYDLSRFESARLAHGYRGDTDWGTFADKTWDADGPYWHLRGNGAIHSTLGDMYRWHLALGGSTILSDAAKEKYFAPHVQEGPGASSWYGYGWVTEETERGRLIWHDGGNPHFSTEVRRYVDADVFIIVTANTSEHRAFAVMSDVADIVFDDSGADVGPAAVEIDPANLDESPAGRTAAAFIRMLRGEAPDVEPFIDSHVAPRLVESVTRDRLRSGFRQDQRRFGQVRITRAEYVGDSRVVLTMHTDTGPTRLLTIDVESEEPHRITGLGIDAVE